MDPHSRVAAEVSSCSGSVATECKFAPAQKLSTRCYQPETEVPILRETVFFFFFVWLRPLQIKLPSNVLDNNWTISLDSLYHTSSSARLRSCWKVYSRINSSHKQTVKTDSAVLDIHFHLHKTLRNILGVATSTGSIVLYRLLNDMYNQPRLEHYRTLNLFDPSVLVLSLVWCTRLPYQLGVSLSNGEVYLIEDEWLANAGTDETSSRKSLMMKHDLEAWNLAFTPSGQASFSGGDDTALRYCSTKPGAHTPSLLPDSSYALPARTWSEGKLHKAGVTAILPLSDQTIVTGSYDDHIRVVSVPNNGRRAVLKELNLGGGVWRLKLMAQQPDSWLEEDKCSANFTILASCMHAGTRVVRLCCSEDGEWSITVLARFEEHKSMNYGSDFQPVTNGTPRTIVSTSFYDKLLCVWHFDQ